MKLTWDPSEAPTPLHYIPLLFALFAVLVSLGAVGFSLWVMLSGA